MCTSYSRVKLQFLSFWVVVLLHGGMFGRTSAWAQQSANEGSEANSKAPRYRTHLADDPIHGIQWESSMEAALKRGKAEKKPVFLAFSVRRLGDPTSPFQ